MTRTRIEQRVSGNNFRHFIEISEQKLSWIYEGLGIIGNDVNGSKAVKNLSTMLGGFQHHKNELE